MAEETAQTSDAKALPVDSISSQAEAIGRPRSGSQSLRRPVCPELNKDATETLQIKRRNSLHSRFRLFDFG